MWSADHILINAGLGGLRVEIRNTTHAGIKIDDMTLRDKVK